jgi:hypothetical protein
MIASEAAFPLRPSDYSFDTAIAAMNKAAVGRAK